MNSINVSKGLFRLWAVLAVCWVTLFTFERGHDLLAQDISRTVTVTFGDGTNRLLENFSSTGTAEDALAQAKAKFPDQEIKHLNRLPTIISVPDWPTRIDTAVWILLPPSLLLLLGLAGLWVIRGFRRSGIQGGSP